VSLLLAGAIAIGSIRRYKAETREAESRYQSLVELSPDGILLADEERRVEFANKAFLRMFGAKELAEVLGRNAFEFIHPDFHPIARDRSLKMDRGEAVGWLEETFVRIDGTPFDAEVAAVPMQKDGRRLSHVFIRDITERKRAASAVKDHQRRLKALFENSLDAIVFQDEVGNVIDANPAASELLGRSHEEIIEGRVGDFAPTEMREAAIRGWQRMRETGQNSGDFTIVRKDGTRREIEFRAVAKAPGLFFSVMSDVTARREAEKALRQLSVQLLHSQDEERRRIARELHEATGQSLVAVKLNLAKMRRSDAISQSVMREVVDESLALTEQSIKEIRTLSYLLHPPMIDEVGLAASLQWLVRGFEHRTGISVTLQAGEDLGKLSEPLETAIYRIVQEGLTNIQRHSGTSAAAVRLARQNDTVELAVEDQGRGIPLALRGQPIERVATGVGMTGMYERVKELGGVMRLHSDDGGTRIAIAIPIRND
jgi:PAS domain S-box-containing protein